MGICLYYTAIPGAGFYVKARINAIGRIFVYTYVVYTKCISALVYRKAGINVTIIKWENCVCIFMAKEPETIIFFLFLFGKIHIYAWKIENVCFTFFCSLLSSIFIFVIRMNDIPLMENYFGIHIVDMCG